ncbi:putative membrane protein YagU involved in acid resistance [Labrenzia sp. EL_13]|nr:putative membrane protein YagU involved in acid resistance [Labrenzia sp. EL_162]MBG6165111.1 putative membrane protein YagU involved in acid resistance [Labrenzia sp. EL_195]MBG6197002.1 putative membrane protein YagU involved in acid resistance [Labrenzia sp. EL_159]MBG6205346.1 putative membrane protein YagU involved in acid resistance [Labrenzia sp. EL_13]
MPTRLDIQNILIAGVIGQLAFEAYAWFISPLLFGLTLEPSNLVMALSKIYIGLNVSYGAAFVVHFFIGAVGFSALVWLTHRVTKKTYIVSGALAGFFLWFVAQGMLAPAVGRTFMMDFGPYTQSSAVAHIGMAMVMGYVMAKLAGRTSRATVVDPAE